MAPTKWSPQSIDAAPPKGLFGQARTIVVYERPGDSIECLSELLERMGSAGSVRSVGQYSPFKIERLQVAQDLL